MSPQGSGGIVIVGDPARRIRDINSRGKGVQNLPVVELIAK